MTKPSVRAEVKELEKLGILPSGDEAEVAQLERIEELYRAIAKPATLSGVYISALSSHDTNQLFPPISLAGPS